MIKPFLSCLLYLGCLFHFQITYSHPIKLSDKKPNDFVYLESWDSTVQQEIRYYGANNFIGRPIEGYHQPRCILTKAAAKALLKANQQLLKRNLQLKVYDCYRPQQAVRDFFRWSQNSADQRMKQAYYPRVDKTQLLKQNYIAFLSGHSRGSTVDLTLVDRHTNQVLDMGTPFDFLDPLSHPSSDLISSTQVRNRHWLSSTMQSVGFKPLATEWWHFTLKHEPYPYTYFNFPVE